MVEMAQKAIDNLRTTAKWLLQVYAAIGALLLAGTPLTKLGQLPWADDRLHIALGSALIAVLAGTTIIYFASSVLVTDATTLQSLQATAQNQQNDPIITYIQNAGVLPQNTTIAQLTNQSEATPNVLMIAAFYRYRERFQRLRWSAIIGSFVVGAAIVLFVWAANPPEVKPVRYQLPDRGTVELTEAGQNRLRDHLGVTCVTRPIPVIVLADQDGFDVVSQPIDSCGLLRFTIKDASIGRVIVSR